MKPSFKSTARELGRFGSLRFASPVSNATDLSTSEVKEHRARSALGWGDCLGRPQGAVGFVVDGNPFPNATRLIPIRPPHSYWQELGSIVFLYTKAHTVNSFSQT